MQIYKKIDELIGKTPLMEVVNLEKQEKCKARIFAKLEFFNPTGSIKDRAALYMLKDAEDKGLVKSGATIIEPTSGNTGIGLAALGTAREYKVILTMPDTMSVERIKLLKAYGAEIVLTDGKLGMKGAIDKANELNKTIANSFIPSQFDNPSNPSAHYYSTAPEIWGDIDGKIDAFVAGVGSGGTVTGAGRYFKEKNKSVKVFAVEPEGSPLISKGKAGAHKIQGIGANFIPRNLDLSVCDGVIAVSDEKAFEYARKIAKAEGVFVGISSGAALSVAVELAAKEEFSGKNIVVILPDSGSRYLSTPLVE